MMKRFLALTLVALCCHTAVSGATFDLDVSAPSALLMEKETGTILQAKDEHTQREPASVTKIMTLLLVMEAMDAGQLALDDVLTASAHASSMGGSQIWLKEGEQMSVHDMLKAVCVVSANDCAVALAEAVAGSETAFVAKMNEKAQALGMENTLFQNATGLPADNHYTTCYDIALMSRELMANHPMIRDYTTIWMDTLRDGASELVNTNKLIYSYSGATGLKTGSTSTALYCLSATAERDGMELIAVVMQAPTSAQRQADVTAMLDYGFASYALQSIVPQQALTPIEVELGQQDFIQPVLEGDTQSLLLAKAQVSTLEQSVDVVELLQAPVSKGDVVGTLTVTSGDDVLTQVTIVAGEDAPRLTWTQMLHQVGQWATFGKP